jgi:Toprim domain
VEQLCSSVCEHAAPVCASMGLVEFAHLRERYRGVWCVLLLISISELFTAPVEKTVKNDADNRTQKIVRNIKQEARNAEWLILWLDCDREGENIAMEVVHVCGRRRRLRLLRAHFSSLIANEIQRAMRCDAGILPGASSGHQPCSSRIRPPVHACTHSHSRNVFTSSHSCSFLILTYTSTPTHTKKKTKTNTHTHTHTHISLLLLLTRSLSHSLSL